MLTKMSGEWKETVSNIFKRASHLWHLPGYPVRDFICYVTQPYMNSTDPKLTILETVGK